MRPSWSWRTSFQDGPHHILNYRRTPNARLLLGMIPHWELLMLQVNRQQRRRDRTLAPQSLMLHHLLQQKQGTLRYSVDRLASMGLSMLSSSILYVGDFLRVLYTQGLRKKNLLGFTLSFDNKIYASHNHCFICLSFQATSR